MPIAKRGTVLRKDHAANPQYQRAEEQWRLGRLKPAFRFFLAAAKAGTVSAFSIVGQFYDQGDGVRVNRNAALSWYRRAYRNGDHSVANNIGCILRDQKKIAQAFQWFRRAVRFGDGDANLNIANLYLHQKHDAAMAMQFLKRVCQARNATEGSKQEARRALIKLKNDLH